MKLRISHECPISILQWSREFNDFDYCLAHLYAQREDYRNFYLESVKILNREVLLDNSIFELGHAFDPEKYTHIIEDLRPTMYIVPDVLENGEATIESWEKFTKANGVFELPGVKIGAIQGKTWDEILKCYKFMSENADMIAISFDFSYYQITGEGGTKFYRMMTGRQRLVKQLIEGGHWNWNKPHHLLGCALPQEFGFYTKNNIHNIRSVDTSNPIVHGLFSIKYNSTFGLKTKFTKKLADLIDEQMSNEQRSCIDYNVDTFYKICNEFQV